jgi:hypothetical protein
VLVHGDSEGAETLRRNLYNAARVLVTTINQLRAGGLREEERPGPRPK